MQARINAADPEGAELRSEPPEFVDREKVEALLAARIEAKQAEDYETADALEEEMLTLGVKLSDIGRFESGFEGVKLTEHGLESAGAPRLASSTNNASSALSETRGQSRRSRCSSARQCPSRQYRAITASEGSKSPEKSPAKSRSRSHSLGTKLAKLKEEISEFAKRLATKLQANASATALLNSRTPITSC